MDKVLAMLKDGGGGGGGKTSFKKVSTQELKGLSHTEGGHKKCPSFKRGEGGEKFNPVLRWGGGGAKSFGPAIFLFCSPPPYN